MQPGFDIPSGIFRDWPSEFGERGLKWGTPQTIIAQTPLLLAYIWAPNFSGFHGQAPGVIPIFHSPPVKHWMQQNIHTAITAFQLLGKLHCCLYSICKCCRHECKDFALHWTSTALIACLIIFH